MHFTGTVYRPPYEAYTPLLQVTIGCSHNKCKFCSMYKDVCFKISPLEEIEQDLREISLSRKNTERIYLVGGDPFVLSFEKLKTILLKIKEYLPNCKSVSMNARISNIKNKTVEQLIELKKLGVTDLYLGPESGDDETLKRINKNQMANDIVEQCKKLEQAGILYVVSYLNGLGGSKLSKQHAINTANIYNQLNPTYTGSGSLTLFEDTVLYEEKKNGTFDDATELERMIELRTFLEHLTTKTYILMHHTSTIVLEGEFPENKTKMLERLDYEIANFDETKHNNHRRNTTGL